MSRKCSSSRLVENELCTINYCQDHNSINLNLGSMTLHLTASQFEGLSRSFSKAVKEKKLIDQTAPASTAPAGETSGKFH